MKITHRSPALASWPLIVREFKDITHYKQQVLNVIGEDKELYKIIYFPVNDSVLCYGEKKVLYFCEDENIEILTDDIVKIETFKELLEASITISSSDHTIKIQYVTATSYIFNPFLNYLCQLDEDCSLDSIEKKNPRPKSLYLESLCMYNYYLDAYRLGSKVSHYDYRYRNKRERWMPWKVHKEEWLSVDNEYGIFKCYSYKYIIKCEYIMKR